MKQALLVLISLLCGLQSAAAQGHSEMLSSAAPAEIDTLLVDGPQGTEALSGYIYYVLDPSWSFTVQDMLSAQSSRFKPIPTIEPNFGYTDSHIWLRLKIKNTSENQTDWQLYVRENFLQYYDVYIARETGEIEHAEKQDRNTKFSERSTPYPELTTPFKLAVGETVTIFIAYWSGGSSHAALSLETANSFSDIAVARTSKNYISYGMMMILIIIATFALVILRLRVFWSYLSYVACTLVYLMHIDGVAFQYLWPNAPTFNSNFTLIIGTLFVLVAYDFARVFLQTKTYHPRMDKLLLFMTIMSPVIVVTGSLVDTQSTKQFIFILIFLAIALGTITGCLAAFTRFRQVRFYLFAWVTGVLIAGMMNLRHNFGFEIAQDREFDAIRIAIVVDAIMMGLGVADKYKYSLELKQKTAKDNLEAAQSNLKLNKRLYDLEEQYQLAKELANSRTDLLRDTVHDIRQPLHALRLSIQKFEDGQDLTTSDKTNIDSTFFYLEELITTYLKDAVLPLGASCTASPNSEIEDELSLNHILSSIFEMFLPDAHEKGLNFRYVATGQNITIDALSLMRVVSNLVSNAIKYTPEGTVILGVRRKTNGLSIEVHDTGVTLTPQQFELAKRRHMRVKNKGPNVAGNGYGLTIANQIAQEQGWVLKCLQGRKTGTSISLFIPSETG